MIPAPAVGDRVLVAVHTGFVEGEAVRGLDTWKTYPPVPGEVVYRGFNGGNHGALFTVKLLADAAPGWSAGDAYRCTVDRLRPPEGPAS